LRAWLCRKHWQPRTLAVIWLLSTGSIIACAKLWFPFFFYSTLILLSVSPSKHKKRSGDGAKYRKHTCIDRNQRGRLREIWDISYTLKSMDLEPTAMAESCRPRRRRSTRQLHVSLEENIPWSQCLERQTKKRDEKGSTPSARFLDCRSKSKRVRH
jgi:hypothetical protein